MRLTSTINLIAMAILVAMLLSRSDVWQESSPPKADYDRVKRAADEKMGYLTELLTGKGLSFEHLELLLVAYKEEKILEIYAKQTNDQSFKLVKKYEICRASGQLGPKWQEGDLQVPEGFYKINVFNPQSNFHLSLGINYPNEADKIRIKEEKRGGDIYIHGACVSTGCLAMTNDFIKEIYTLANGCGEEQKKAGIPVYIFPNRMTAEGMERLKSYSPDSKLMAFWENLREGYVKFLLDKKPLDYEVGKGGIYLYK